MCARHGGLSLYILTTKTRQWALRVVIVCAFFSAAVRGQQPAESRETIFKTPAEDNLSLSGQEDSSSDRRPFLAGIYPEDLKPLLPGDYPAVRYFMLHRVRSYGWIDCGFTSASNASGLVTEAPTGNRFSNQAMLNAAWITVERPTNQRVSWGFRADFYAGSDPAFLRPYNSFGPSGPRWGTDFRQAYLALHTTSVLKHGIDWTAGRMNNTTGYESLMAPYRPIYSETYYWLHYEVGSTAVHATLHPTDRFDLNLGVVAGYNTAFELRGRAPGYVARAIYRPRGEKSGQWLATVYTGPLPVFTTKGHQGTWQTVYELQTREVLTPRLVEIIQAHYAVDRQDPAVGRRDTTTQGAFAITAYKFSDKVYLNTRAEWFDDPHGIRAPIPGTYSEATAGVAFYPLGWFSIRPELRGDFAGQPSFGSLSEPARHRNQLSGAVEITFKGRLF